MDEETQAQLLQRQIPALKEWLGKGSINIFGLPMSGKDTVGVRLAEDLGARFISSGLIIRAAEEGQFNPPSASGQLIPTDMFFDLVLPYFSLPELADSPLVLSSIGRWKGEEDRVMTAAEAAGHPIKAAILLNISEADVTRRWHDAKLLGDRNNRADDQTIEVFETRLAEFRTKTLPVMQHYKSLGLLVEAHAKDTRTQVYLNVVNALCNFAGIKP